MSVICRSLAGLLLVFGVLGLSRDAAAAPQPPPVSLNGESADEVDPGFCVIQPDEPASIEIHADYQGRRFYFCCELCRQDFLSDPSRFDSLYRDEPSEATPYWNPDDSPYANSFWGRVGRAILAVRWAQDWIHSTLHLDDTASAALAFCSTLWFLFLFSRWRRTDRRTTGLRPSPLTAALVTLMIVPCSYAVSLRRVLNETETTLADTERERALMKNQFDEVVDRDAIHYATFFNFGNPPVPRPSLLRPSLQKTYYRGNDERSDAMFNGGNYRTVTFDLWIEDGAGSLIQPGSRIVDEQGVARPLSLAVRFTRSPETSSGYFTAKYMERMFLTMQSGDFLGREEPVSDRLAWTMTTDEQVWEARYLLPEGIVVRQSETPYELPKLTRTLDPQRPNDLGGVVYLCEERFDGDRVIGARFHYAVQYDLRAKDGIVQEKSDLWMQATYRGRNFADLQIDDEQWLSSEPIPQK